MTVWQSFALISPAQWAYAFGLAVLFWLRGPSLVAWVLLADFVAILAVAGAMDFRLIEKSDARLFMLVIWAATAAIMVTQPGVGRVIAAISAIMLAIFAACLAFGVQMSATSAIVNAGAFIILAVATYGLGSGGDTGGGRADRPLPVGLQGGNLGIREGGGAIGAALLSSRGEVK